MDFSSLFRGSSNSEAGQFDWTRAYAFGLPAIHVIGRSGERLDIHPNSKPMAIN
jgi:hypothetical protein